MSTKIISTKLPVTGLSCSSCALNIEKRLRASVGITNVSVSFPNKIVTIEYDPSLSSLLSIQAEVRSIGYDLIIDSDDPQEKMLDLETKRSSVLKRKLIIALLFTVPL